MNPMKHRVSTLVLAIALLVGGSAPTRAGAGLESEPAYLPIDKAIDLKTLRPEVNVNLPRFLLQDAVSEMNGGKDDPLAGTGINLAELIKDVKLIRVVVFDVDKTQRAALSNGVVALREILETRWTPIATVPNDNVGVYALGDASGESIAGLAVLVHDGDNAVVANIVGRVSLSKIVKVASRFDKFPKDLLKKLGAGGGEPEAKPQPAAKPEPTPEKTKP